MRSPGSWTSWDDRARTSGRASAGDVAFLYWRLGDTGAITELAREAESWSEADDAVAASRVLVEAAGLAAASDSSALGLIREARPLFGCAGCMRRLEVEVLRDQERWPQLIENAEDLLARPLDASRGPADEPLVRLYLAEAYEGVGDRDAAADNYARFAELWSDADPELLSEVARARQRATELGATSGG